MKNIKDKFNTEKLVITALILTVLLLCIVMIISVSEGSSNQSTFGLTNQAEAVPTEPKTLVKSADEVMTASVEPIEADIEIKLNETPREYGNITTYIFDVVKKDNGEVCKLSDGIISIEDIIDTIDIFLEEHPFETVSIGVVDNKFYIQQNTSKEIDSSKHLRVNIMSLNDTFSASDWFSMTEAVLNSVDVQTDSVFSYQANIGSKHYIYIFLEDK